MRVFGQVLVMTQGGPIGSTYTLVQHLYSVGWINFRQGEAAAIGLILFVITFLLTVMQLYAFGALDFAVKREQKKNQSRAKKLMQLFKPIRKGYRYFISVFLDSLFYLSQISWDESASGNSPSIQAADLTTRRFLAIRC